ncbi:MAG: oligosaccharide flippase family protein, partial [Planctomycetaceae bacterium]
MSQTMLRDERGPGVVVRHRFLVQVARSLGMRALAAGLTFAVVPICIRTLGMRGFGEYAIAISWMSILTVAAKLGFDTASLRYVAQYRSQAEGGLLQGFVRTSRRLSWGASLALGIGLAGVTLLLRERLSAGLFQSLLGAAALIPLVAAIQLREAGLLASGRVMSGQLGGVLLPLLLIVLIGVVPLVSGVALTSSRVVLLNLCSAVVTLGVMALLSRRVITPHFGDVRRETRVKEWFSVASPLLLVQLLGLLLSQSGTVLCGWLIDEQAAGLYSAVARVASVLLLGLQAIGIIAAPTIASLYHSGRIADLERYVRRCALASFSFAGSFCLVMLIGGRSVLTLLGEEVVAGVVPLAVLLIGLAVESAAGPGYYLMLMTGRQGDCCKVYGARLA